MPHMLRRQCQTSPANRCVQMEYKSTRPSTRNALGNRRNCRCRPVSGFAVLPDIINCNLSVSLVYSMGTHFHAIYLRTYRKCRKLSATFVYFMLTSIRSAMLRRVFSRLQKHTHKQTETHNTRINAAPLQLAQHRTAGKIHV